MDENGFKAFLAKRNYSEAQLAEAFQTIRDFEDRLARHGRDFASATEQDLREHLAGLVRDGRNSETRLVDLARYCYHAKRNDFYIYFTAVVGGREVLESIAARLETVAGPAVREKVFQGIAPPPLGSPPEAFPPVTQRLMERLQEHLSPEQCRSVLAWNHHGIPVESFAKHKEWFAQEQSIEAFLKRVHREAVAELERYAAEGRIWYEQEITPEVVEFVRANQEILSAVRDGDRLYLTKIPYAPQQYIHERDPLMKRYYACHCPLARASILSQDVKVPFEWCNCSGGFQKLMFDVVFEEPVEVELLESALRGDPRCRFAVKISPEAR